MWQALGAILSQLLGSGDKAAASSQANAAGVNLGDIFSKPYGDIQAGGLNNVLQGGGVTGEESYGNAWGGRLLRALKGGAQDQKTADAIREKTIGDLYGSNILNRLGR